MKIQSVGYKNDKRRHIEPHSHAFTELVYYLSGCGESVIGGERVPFHEGDIIVIPAGVPHEDDSDTDFHSCFFTFSDDNLNSRVFFRFRDTEERVFLNILKQMYNEYNLRRTNYEIIVDSLYEVLYQYMLTLSEDRGSNPYVAGLIDDIIKNQSDPDYDLAAAVSRIPMSSSHVRELFRQKTGSTPLQFLTSRRIEHAKDMLRVRSISGVTMEAIAYSAGFGSNYYFSRVFKKYTGQSPREWEAHLRKTGAKK
jgi:AraC-like DNA-binding protein